MPNLRIVTKNALRQAASLTASSTAGNLAVSSLAAAVKSSLHRFTGTNGSYRATWAAPARIGCVALPFCNWSPTAKQRVRVSKERSVTNLLPNSEGSVASLPFKGGVVTDAGPFGNFANWARIAPSTSNSWAYRTVAQALEVGTVATFSMFIVMDDGGAPVVGNTNTSGDFTFVLNGDAANAANTTIQNLGGGLYRVSKTLATPRSNSAYGLAKYSSQSARGFRVTGFMLELGDKMTSYYPSQNTFTSRASIGTYIGSDGLIKTAAANVARMQYDPANPLAPAKLLLEPAATNYCKGSETLSGWSGPPARNTSAQSYKGIPYIEITKVQGTLYEYVRSPSFNRTAGTVQTLTVALRAGTSDKVSVGLYNATSPTWGLPAECTAAIISGPGTMYGTDGIRDILGLSKTEDTVVQITRLHTVSAADAGVFIYPGRASSATVGDSILATRVQVEDANVAYGPELVTNGTFAQDTIGWTASNATLSVNAQALRVATGVEGTTGQAYQNIQTVPGKMYTLRARLIYGTTSAYIGLNLDGGAPSIGVALGGNNTSGTVQDVSFSFVATKATTSVILYNGALVEGKYADFDNISVQEEAGVDLITNGAFTTASGWVLSGSGIAVNTSTGKLVFSSAPANNQMYQTIGTLVQGKQYAITYTIDAISAGSIRVIFNGTGASTAPARSAPGTYTEIITLNDAINRNLGIQAVGSATTATIDNISVREVNNLVLNGTFDADTTGWTVTGSSTLSVNWGALRVVSQGASGALQVVATTVGRRYAVSAEVKASDVACELRLASDGVGFNNVLYVSPAVSGARTITQEFTATTTSTGIYLRTGATGTTEWDNIVVKDVTELVTNGTFEGTGAGWTVDQPGTTSGVFNSGTATLTGDGTNVASLTQGLATTAGKAYSLSFTSAVAAVAVNVGTTANGSQLTYLSSSKIGENILTFTAAGATTYITFRRSSTGPATLDNISVKEFTLVPVVSSYIPTTTAAVTRAADVYTSAPGVRPDGYIDHWQSYDYDSGWVLACPAPAVELEGFTPAQAASAYAYGGGAYARDWLPQQMDATGLAVDIADPDNLQGYIEAACMVAGPVWSPRYNASGTSVSVIDRTELSRSAAGDQLADPGTISRKVPVDLRAMPEEDRARFLDLVRNSRAHPILMSVFPEHPDLALERDFMVYGRRTKDSDIAYQFAGAYSTTLEIEEI